MGIFTVPLAIIGSFSPQNTGKIMEMAMLFGLACILPVLLVFFFTREKKEYMTAAQPALAQSLRAAVHEDQSY